MIDLLIVYSCERIKSMSYVYLSKWVKVYRLTRHIIGYFGDGFYRPDDPTSSVSYLYETII